MKRYVYGLIRAQDAQTFDIEGLGPSGPKPEAYPLGDGVAMISTPYRGDQIRPSRRNMLTHTRVLEHVMLGHDVLPLRFGTVLPAASEGRAILAANKTQFLDAFDKVNGCRELSLKIFWRDGIAFKEVIESDRALRAKRDALASRDPAQSHYERIEFGRRVEAAISAKRESEAKTLRLRLQHLSNEFLSTPASDDVMVANFSFLANAAQETALDEAVNLLDEIHGARLSFRYVGPMPAFSFVDVKIEPASTVREAV